MSSSNAHSPELRERAVHMVLNHQGDHGSQWAAIGSIAESIGCASETLRKRGPGRPNVAKPVAQGYRKTASCRSMAWSIPGETSEEVSN